MCIKPTLFTGNSVVYGDIGLYPGSAVTGFGTAITFGALDIANPAALAAQVHKSQYNYVGLYEYVCIIMWVYKSMFV
jgi:hypothetical protein